MKCRICGAKLRKEGDICKSCYEEYCKEEELDNDVNEIYKIHRKHLPSYQLTQYLEILFMGLIVILAFFMQQQYLYSLFSIIIMIFILGVLMFFAKRKAINTVCIFYEKKIVLTYKGISKTIAYSDLKEVTYYQSFFQKLFKLADLQFRPANGSYLTNGFEIKNIPDFDNTWKKIEEIIISKREK